MTTRKALDMVSAAKREIENLSVDQVRQELAGGDAVLIDVRDQEERLQNGVIAGSVHVSRGMLEFAADPTLPSYKDCFREERRLILHCASGGRSALAALALTEMGYTNVAHLESGFKGWLEAGAPVEEAS